MNSTSFKKKPFRYSVGDRFIDKNRNLEIIDKYEKIRIRSKSSKEYQKIYVCKCHICGTNEAVIEQNHLSSGRGCPVCHGKQVSVGINDIPTTAPWMIPYFQGGYDEAKKYTNQSNAKLYFKCPCCGEIKHNLSSINHLYNRRNISCVCQDGISYSEKYMYCLLTQLHVNFIMQFADDWCKPYRYDFYLPDYSLIIEMHGYQHYNLCKYNENDYNKLTIQKNTDKYKKELAFKNNILAYFEIDSRYSEKYYMEESIKNSGILDIFLKLNIEINFNKCHEFATSNLLKEVCQCYEKNKKRHIVDIAKDFKIDPCTVTRYLKTGTNLGFCSYNPKYVNILKSKSVKIYKKDGSFDIYNSAQELQDISQSKYGTMFLKDGIRNVCSKKKKSYKGFYFEYVF